MCGDRICFEVHFSEIRSFGKKKKKLRIFVFIFVDFLGVLCLLLMFSEIIYGQRDVKWAWSSNNNNRNSVDDARNRQLNRRRYENVEDFR